MKIAATARLRLARTVRLLSSNQVGEVTAAVAAMARILESEGLDFHALADEIERPVPVQDDEPPRRGRQAGRWGEIERVGSLDVLRWALDNGVCGSLGEREFLGQMVDQFESKPWKSTTLKQEQWLARIAQRAARKQSGETRFDDMGED